jgi:hypothetical protein
MAAQSLTPVLPLDRRPHRGTLRRAGMVIADGPGKSMSRLNSGPVDSFGAVSLP